MNLTEIKNELLFTLKPFFESNGFKLKGKSPNIEFIRENGLSQDNFGMSFSTYVGNAKSGYGYGKSQYEVSRIINEIIKVINLREPVALHDESLFVGMGQHFSNSNTEEKLKTEIYSIESAKEVCESIIKRSEEVLFPLLKKFEDLREIDKIINNLEDLWYDDWMKPFSLGGNFYVKRFIIAKLSGNPRYEELSDRVFDMIDKRMEEQGRDERADRISLDKPIPYTVNLLKYVKPLYESYE